MTRAISLHNVSKTYTPRGVRVVDPLSLAISPREFLVLLGPSGCGKSTVLRMIAGPEEIDAGRLFLDGELPTHCRPPTATWRWCFRNFALYPGMTGRDDIGFPLRIENTPDRLPDLGEQPGAGHRGRRAPGGVSGTMRTAPGARKLTALVWGPDDEAPPEGTP
ncbi:ATP-binding cassette domain-containing protein [Streptomyces sp. NPDC005925]|uniref:ATP-binding cassette domain-containing protein n=1 Tax=Streptomyces sp. NPDC005925 TaxID=3157172 RepID=UPI0033C3C606